MSSKVILIVITCSFPITVSLLTGFASVDKDMIKLMESMGATKHQIKTGIDRPKNLEGKKYATWDSPIELATIRKIVEQDGGDFSKIQLIPSTVYDVVTALNTEIDAVWIYYAWDGVKLELDGIDSNYLDFRKIDDTFDYYTPMFISNTKFLETDSETAKKFLKALRRGYEFSIDNPDKAAEILCKAAPELDRNLVFASQNWISKEYKAEVEPWGYINPERWNRFFRWLNNTGLLEGTLPENYGFTNDYLN
ncbi:MAG: ABC transporter substrate-binding protein [Treponema sp.]|nr:ABC transporter substrate-binding protein [Treponema sp.]